MCTNYISPIYNNIYQSLPIHVLWTQNTSKFKAFLFLIFFHWLVHCTFVIKAPNFVSLKNCINLIFIQFFFWQVDNFSAMINFCKQVLILFLIQKYFLYIASNLTNIYCTWIILGLWCFEVQSPWMWVNMYFAITRHEIIGFIKYL